MSMETIDNTNPSIVYSPSAAWGSNTNADFFNGTLRYFAHKRPFAYCLNLLFYLVSRKLRVHLRRLHLQEGQLQYTAQYLPTMPILLLQSTAKYKIC